MTEEEAERDLAEARAKEADIAALGEATDCARRLYETLHTAYVLAQAGLHPEPHALEQVAHAAQSHADELRDRWLP